MEGGVVSRGGKTRTENELDIGRLLNPVRFKWRKLVRM